ncbi:MAG: toll/interleukin-1 receptor domain-containing protein [Leptolyngbyaceae cyanobacterium MO_188.B28]|nr:toll/interleukin-1 receptor domain-containing protein [Leptolyngbyaceae cyanobacterium MO_188.B28]
MPTPGSIFISYRRSDSIEATGRIYDYLEGHFGREHVFKDVDSIPLGVNFREYLDQEVGRCKVLVAVIGPTWLTVVGADGKRRLESPEDFVRIEIESALRRKIPVIPLFVNNAAMPNKAELPGELKALPDWQSMVIRHDPDFRRDVKKLIQGIESIMGQSQSPQARPVSPAKGIESIMGQSQSPQARPVSPVSPPRSSGSRQRNRPKTRAIPWLRLAIVLGLYGFQGWFWALGAPAEAWAVAVAVAVVGAVAVAVVEGWAGAVAVAVAVAVAMAVAWAVVLAVAWAVVVAGAVALIWTGRKLKAHFRPIQVFGILGGTETAGLIAGALLGFFSSP